MLQIILEPSTSVMNEEPLVSAAPSAGLLVGLFILGVVLITVLGVVIFRLLRLLRRPDLHGTSREQILKRWAQVEQLTTQGVMGSKLAIIEADKLLDHVLRSMAMPGTTLGERLKSASYRYPTIHKVWTAHRLRNQLVHDTACELSTREARRALDDFKHALTVLNVM